MRTNEAKAIGTPRSDEAWRHWIQAGNAQRLKQLCEQLESELNTRNESPAPTSGLDIGQALKAMESGHICACGDYLTFMIGPKGELLCWNKHYSSQEHYEPWLYVRTELLTRSDWRIVG